MKVMVGGTFDPLHDGHKRLLTRSFALAGPDGEGRDRAHNRCLCEPQGFHPIHPFAERKADLERFIAEGVVAVASEKKYATRWELEPLSDRFGSALDADFDAIRRLRRDPSRRCRDQQDAPGEEAAQGGYPPDYLRSRGRTVAGSPLPVSGAGRSIPTGT